MKHLRITLIVMVSIAVLFVLIFNEFLIYAALFIGVVVIFYLLYSAFVQAKDQEIDKLQRKLAEDDALLAKIQEENNELRDRKFNMAAVKQILDIGLFEIDTNFTRTWNEEQLTEEGKTVQFIGALKVDVIAKYGIDLKELRIKITDTELLIANLNLKSLSFTDLIYTWKIAEVLEHKTPYLGGNHRRTNVMLELEANKIKERLQKRTHDEVKKGPEEVNAVVQILKKQLTNSIGALLGVSNKSVRFVDYFDNDFKMIDGLGQLEM